jgi:hypothetical protein
MRRSLNTRLNISMADDMSFNPTRDDFEALLNDSLGGRDFMEGTVVKGIVVGPSRRTSPSSTSV